MRCFKNPSNGNIESSGGPFSWLLALLWLEIYLLVKGNFRHFLLPFFLLLGSFFLDTAPLLKEACFLLRLLLHVIYAFIIGKVNAAQYLRKGWIEVWG